VDSWKLQDAKARFSEVVDRALRDGPQLVTRHGENAVAVVAYRDLAEVRSARRARPQAKTAPAEEDIVVSFLLDTNVVSELTKKRPKPHVMPWVRSVSSIDLFLSVVTLAEIGRGSR
jgi:prevent-host-death family protein